MEYVDELRAEITRRLSNAEQPDDEQVRRVIDRVIFESEARTSLSVRDRVKLKTQLFDSIRRLDILSEYLDDDRVTEIMVNGPKDIFIERDGQVIRTDKVFAGERVLSDLIQQIVAGVNRRVNEASPVVDARLSDGSRVNIVLKPIALDGPVMTIRKFSKHRLSMASLVENNTLSAEVCEFLKTLVQSRYNIFISG
ncbi:MAG: Flp pilus assembly complex ATPase component TadA, partial [Lachnospiraceae bacterium]|nr:Flp pilus assembly complex ATPase component TadA [Lachnospiraceae bacterium]